MPPKQAAFDSSYDFSQVFKDLDLSIVTKQNYIDRMRALEKMFEADLFSIIKDASKSIKHLKAAYAVPSSRKAYLSLVLSLFRHLPELKAQLPKQFALWFEAFKEVDKAIEERYKTNEPSDRQLEGYVPYDEIVEKRDSLQKGSVERLLLGMYTHIYPLRGDFNMVRLYKTVPPKPEANYIHMARNKCKLVLSEYKTASTHGVFEKELPSALCAEIHESLENMPRNYLFVANNRLPFDKPRSYVAFANRVFAKLFGKPLTISLIRHSFISTLDFNTLTIAEKEAIAAEMRHTTRLQDQYRLIFRDKPT